MKLFFNHGVKITFANLFGLTLNLILFFIGLFIFGSTFLLFTISTSIVEFFSSINHSLSEIFTGNLNFNEFFSFLSFEKSPIWAILSVFVLFFYCLYQTFIQSMMIGGLYGSSIHAIFDKHASIGAYFSYSFRNLGRLTRLQLLLLFLSLPMLILIIFVVIGLETLVDSPNIIYFQTSFSGLLLLLFCTLFLHSPIFIIKNKIGVWHSIQLSLQLLKHALYPILFSAVIFFAILAIMNGIYIGAISALLSYVDAHLTEMPFDHANFEAILIIVIGFLIWFCIVLPYSIICALLMLVQRYKLYLHHFIDKKDEQVSADHSVDHPPDH